MEIVEKEETAELIVRPEAKVYREKILQFREALAQVPGVKFGDMDECPLKHTFADGVYVREIFIPKGMLIVGKIHRHAHPNFILKGEVSIVTESGGVQRLKAPMSLISPAGTKRVVFAHEDTVWITVHVTKETDLDKIEKVVIAETYEEFDASLSLESQKTDESNVEKMIETIKSEGK